MKKSITVRYRTVGLAAVFSFIIPFQASFAGDSIDSLFGLNQRLSLAPSRVQSRLGGIINSLCPKTITHQQQTPQEQFNVQEGHLRTAIKAGDLPNVHKYFVAISLDANAKEFHNHAQSSLLHLASYYGHVNVMEYLIKNGADVNAENKYKERPLHTASAMSRFSAIQLLKEKGAVDAPNEFNETAEQILNRREAKLLSPIRSSL